MKKLFWVFLVILVTGCGKEEATSSAATVGPAGKDGMTVSSFISCSELTTVNSIALFATYQIITYSTGDQMIDCGLSDALANYSQTMFYPASRAGTATSSCLLTYDVDSASGGFWKFTNSDNVKKAVYTDTASGKNGSVIIFDSCTEGL